MRRRGNQLQIVSWWHRNLDPSLDPDIPAPPERRLLCAILERALRDLLPVQEVQYEDRRDAILWFKAVYPNESEFTFKFICEELTLKSDSKSLIFKKVKEAEEWNQKLLDKKRREELDTCTFSESTQAMQMVV